MKSQLSLAQMQLLRKSKKLVDEETRSIVRQMSAEFRQLPNLRSTSLSIH
jgi:DNA-directed RNA polymerase subunit H (RpoH/RPB5)